MSYAVFSELEQTYRVAECSAWLHPFNGPFSGTTRVSQYQKGRTNLDFTEARDSEKRWHQLGHMQVCTSLQTDNHASTPPLSFLQAGCPSCRPTNSVKALKAKCSAWLVIIKSGCIGWAYTKTRDFCYSDFCLLSDIRVNYFGSRCYSFCLHNFRTIVRLAGNFF